MTFLNQFWVNMIFMGVWLFTSKRDLTIDFAYLFSASCKSVFVFCNSSLVWLRAVFKLSICDDADPSPFSLSWTSFSNLSTSSSDDLNLFFKSLQWFSNSAITSFFSIRNLSSSCSEFSKSSLSFWDKLSWNSCCKFITWLLWSIPSFVFISSSSLLWSLFNFAVTSSSSFLSENSLLVDCSPALFNSALYFDSKSSFSLKSFSISCTKQIQPNDKSQT